MISNGSKDFCFSIKFNNCRFLEKKKYVGKQFGRYFNAYEKSCSKNSIIVQYYYLNIKYTITINSKIIYI